MSLKIMHTGDLHLGMKFSQYPTISSQLEEARYQALKNVVQKANQKKANILAVAGDLFDKISVKEEVIIKSINILDQFVGDVILILPGNHDYQDGINALWGQFRKNQRGRMLLLDQKQIYDLNDFGLDAAVYSAPCDSRLSKTNNLGWIKDLKTDLNRKYKIGMAHGAIAGFSPDLTNNYFKMEKEELLSLKLDLWLLGHSHLPYPEQKKVQNHKIFNSSTPEPDGMDCSHQGYAWFIELKKNKEIEAERVVVGNYQFLDLDFEVNNKADLKSLLDKILSNQPQNKLLRLAISGHLPKEVFADKDQYLNKLRNNLFYAEIDQSNLNIKIDQKLIAAEFSCSSFPYQLLDDLKDDEEALHLAYQILKEVQD